MASLMNKEENAKTANEMYKLAGFISNPSFNEQWMEEHGVVGGSRDKLQQKAAEIQKLISEMRQLGNF